MIYFGMFEMVLVSWLDICICGVGIVGVLLVWVFCMCGCGVWIFDLNGVGKGVLFVLVGLLIFWLEKVDWLYVWVIFVVFEFVCWLYFFMFVYYLIGVRWLLGNEKDVSCFLEFVMLMGEDYCWVDGVLDMCSLGWFYFR